MNAIVCADAHWGIGNHNALLADIPADKKMFRERTTGNVIIGGRKTMEAFPGKKALPERINIVLSAQKNYSFPGAFVAHSLDEALTVKSRYLDRDVYVIGGQKIYRQFLPYCDRAYVTRVDFLYEADAFFPNLDQDKDWVLSDASERYTHRGLTYQFFTYDRADKSAGLKV